MRGRVVSCAPEYLYDGLFRYCVLLGLIRCSSVAPSSAFFLSTERLDYQVMMR
jgi:hypothetical protein